MGSLKPYKIVDKTPLVVNGDCFDQCFDFEIAPIKHQKMGGYSC